MTRIEVAERLEAILAEATADENAVCYVTSDDAEALDIAIKALEAWEMVEKDIHNAIDNALMYGYGDNYINACEHILQIIQKQEKLLKMDKAESEDKE